MKNQKIKNMKKIKEIVFEIVAAAIVAFGVGMLTLYLVEVFSFLSLFAGLVGYLIIRPAVTYYKELIEDFFKENLDI
jgi:hypothetical protein